MKTFEYRGFDHEGYAKRGLVEALDPKDAREKLSRRGVLAERIDPASDAAARGRWRGRGASIWNWSLVYRELAALLGSGLPVVRALDVLIDSPEHGPIRLALAAMRDRVREGSSLADALAAVRPGVAPFEKAVIGVGEKSGSLETVLERLGEFVEEQQQLRERVQSALIYPMIVVAFAFCVATVMLGFVIPFMGGLLREAHVALPVLTRVMMRLGKVILVLAPVVVAAGVGAGVYVRRRSRRDAAFAEAWDRRLFHLPWFGAAYAILVNLRFVRTLSILLRGGVPVIEGLALAGRATGSAWLERQIGEQAESVRHGSSIADALRRVTPLSASLPGWVQTGEASGALDRLLDTAGNRYQYQWNRFISRSLSFLEPALILFVGLIVLLVTLSILLPVISLNRAVS